MLQKHIYVPIRDETAMMIMTLSDLPSQSLKDAALELQVDYEMFCTDYARPLLSDSYAGFRAMLSEPSMPWEALEESALNGMTLAQFYLAFAWQLNDLAYYFLSGTAVRDGTWTTTEALMQGLNSAISTAKCIDHAKLLMATGQDVMAQRECVPDEE